MSFPFSQELKGTSEATADLIIGCDGAFSAVRKQMLQYPGFDFNQTYIEHGYLELCIPPANGDVRKFLKLVSTVSLQIFIVIIFSQFAMPKNYLHIWPRGKFMMIALPNQDCSWTVTLFMPFKNFEKLRTADELLDFFQEHFPDAIPLIGEKRLVDDYFRAIPQHLVSVKCRPYYLDANVLLMGDAAHAMVPFFGQGMNAGFEDCSILSALLTKHNNDFHRALQEFSDTRWENAHAICDLAMYNYIEMRDLVTRKSYRIRKTIDDFLFWLMPSHWVPLYNSVSFTHMPYKQCVENRAWQNKVYATSDG